MISDDLRSTYNAPSRLTSEYLDEQMQALQGWHKDAATLAREGEGFIQEEVETLVGAMTDAELHAARKLYATVSGLLSDLALKAYDRSDPPSHKVSRHEMAGITWPIFVRCLATYEHESSHLTTWIQLDSRQHFETYLRDIRDRDDTNKYQRVRRKVYQKQRETLTEKGRHPSREECIEVAKEVAAESWSDKTPARAVDHVLKQDIPVSMDKPVTENGQVTFHDLVADENDYSKSTNAKEVGEQLAKALGKEKEWDRLTKD